MLQVLNTNLPMHGMKSLYIIYRKYSLLQDVDKLSLKGVFPSIDVIS